VSFPDEWTDQLFEASVDDFVVLLMDFQDDLSRSQTVHEIVNRNGGFVADDGQTPRDSSWQILFVEGIGDRSPNDTHLNRLQDFIRLLDGQRRSVVHPISGAFFAKPGRIGFGATGGKRGVVRMSVEWIEDTPDPAAFEVGQQVSVQEAVDQVAITVAELDSALAERGLSSDVGADALSTVESWESDANRRQRDLTLEVNRLARQIETESTRLALATDLQSSPLVLAFNRIQVNVTDAAARLLSNAPRLVQWVAPKAMPLYVVVQTLYGSEDAEERYQQLLTQNTIKDPLRVPEGAVLVVEEP
jgi:hypothetical protein